MIAVVPGYISRSVAGSYDNEGEFATLGAGKPLTTAGGWNATVKTLQGTIRGAVLAQRAPPGLCGLLTQLLGER